MLRRIRCWVNLMCPRTVSWSVWKHCSVDWLPAHIAACCLAMALASP